MSALNPDDPDFVDLSVPPDGKPDNLAYPYTYLKGTIGQPLLDALALSMNNFGEA